MNSTQTANSGGDESNPNLWWQILCIVLLSIMTGIFSGLNLGIISLDPNYLELLARGPYETKEDERDAIYAKRIIPLRKRGNLLLSTIILGNVSVQSLLSILMANLTDGLIGTIISTTITVIIGEIIPQSIFSRHALVVGAHTTWILWIFVGLTFPITFPLSAILDKILGHEDGEQYNKTKMKKLFEIYEKDKLLDPSERKILSAALELQDKIAQSVMTPLEKCFMLDIDSLLDKEQLRQIYSKGFSRIPIYEGSKEHIVGVLMLQSILMKTVVNIDENTRLEPILTYFKKGQSHLAIITRVEQHLDKDPSIRMIGIITLEDIIEELIELDNEQKNNLLKNGEDDADKLSLKEKLVLLFSSGHGGKTLSNEEIIAVCEFLQKQVKAFNASRMRRNILIELIQSCPLEEIHSKYNANIKSHFALKDIQDKQNSNEQASPAKQKIDKLQITQARNYFQDNKVSPAKRNVGDQDQQEGVPSGIVKMTLGGHSVSKQSFITETKPEEIKSFLFKKGEQSDEFILVLQGNVAVQTGEDNFQVTLSTFNHLAVDALINDSYTPDFTARVSQYARVLRINRVAYRKAISDPKNFEK
eukprot:403355771